MKNFWINIECPECDGNGFHEIGPECSRPASDCCGGCYRKEGCDYCCGEGEIEIPFYQEDAQEMIQMIIDGSECGSLKSFVHNLIIERNN